METLHLVIGANGHLGNNLVRQLLKREVGVRASVRNPDRWKTVPDGADEVVYADLLDK